MEVMSHRVIASRLLTVNRVPTSHRFWTQTDYPKYRTEMRQCLNGVAWLLIWHHWVSVKHNWRQICIILELLTKCQQSPAMDTLIHAPSTGISSALCESYLAMCTLSNWIPTPQDTLHRRPGRDLIWVKDQPTTTVLWIQVVRWCLNGIQIWTHPMDPMWSMCHFWTRHLAYCPHQSTLTFLAAKSISSLRISIR